MSKSSHRRDSGCHRVSVTKIIWGLVLVVVLLVQYLYWSLLPSDNTQSTLKSPLSIQSTIISSEDFSSESSDFPRNEHHKALNQLELELSATTGDYLFNSSKNIILPGISEDHSELFLSSLIERTSQSNQLHVTTFLLNTAVAVPNKVKMETISKIHTQFGADEWTKVIGKMSRIQYARDGRRVNMSYSCRIFDSIQIHSSYVVKGEYVPNTQSLDKHMNNRLDILRCPLISSVKLRQQLKELISSSTSYLGVEILRGNKVIGQFSIPWKHRRVGYLMSPFHLQALNVSNSNEHFFVPPVMLSGLDAWEGQQVMALKKAGGNVSHPYTHKFHLCVTGLHQLQTDYFLLYRLVEFIEYHILLGVHHIYFTFNLMEDSTSFTTLVTTLSSYIKDGYITMTTTSETRAFRHMDSILGLQFHRASLEAFHINSCLYLSKGVADYLGVWKVNDFVVPLPPSHSIMTMIQAASMSSRNKEVVNNIVMTKIRSKDGRNSSIAATSCFLIINGLKKYMPSSHKSASKVSLLSISEQYSFRNDLVIDDNTHRLIMNTANIFQGGVTSPGACFPSGSHVTTAESSKGDDTVLRIEDGQRIHMHYEGYLYTLKSDMLPKQQKYRKGKSLTFSDNIAKALFLRSEYKIKERFPNERNLADIAIEAEQHNKLWKAYTAIYRPTYEVSEGIKRSDIKGLNEQEIWIQKSQNGYIHVDEYFIPPQAGDYPQNSLAPLPKFATDNSDVALGSLIERKFKSWDLFITTFFIHHEIFNADDGYGILRIEKNKSHNWKQAADIFSKTKYSPSGIRQSVGQVRYRCRIKNSGTDPVYEVNGEFMPSKLNSDSNANNKLDIFRCQMKHAKECYQLYSGSDEHVDVTIINSNNDPIFHYTIPWKTRRCGYLLSSPSVADSFQPWKAFQRNNSHNLPGVGGDDLYMSAPGIESPVSQKTLPMYLEFMQHHFLVGVQHMFASGPYAWGSLMMSNFLTATKSFISEGLLTLNSQAGDHLNLINSVLGASFDRDIIKVIYVNMCLYLTKGMVNYLAVWDIDEYFIPQLPHHTILDVIRAAEAPTPLQPLPPEVDPDAHRGAGRGWADDINQPFCYLMLSSEVIFSSLGYPEEFDQLKPWIGFKYPHLPEPKPTPRYAFKKTIIATNRIFQAGLHMHGNCVVGKKWKGMEDYQARDISSLNFNTSAVILADYKRILPNEATIYHFQMHRSYEKANPTSLLSKNQYTLRYFPAVFNELRRRGMNILVTIPDNAAIVATADTEWKPLEEVTLQNSTVDNLRIKPPRKQLHGTLPAFADDLSEMFIGSVMERSFDSNDLHITTFLLCHAAIMAEASAVVERKHEQKWATLRSFATKRRYAETGIRNNHNNFFCKITNFKGSQSYTVKGHFIPNKLLVDSNANSKVDVFRCPMRKSKYSISDLSGSKLTVSVEILRGKIHMVKFDVPWKTRRVGFMLSAPSAMSRLNMWKYLGKSDTPKSRANSKAKEIMQSSGDALHMCVPGFESPMAKRIIAIYAEFLQHHYDLGVEHVHAAAAYKWEGTNMNLFTESFHSYIEEGFLSIVSLSDDADRVPGWMGLTLDRDIIKVIFVNMCLYLTKGMVDYLAVWDIDEYFIPQLPHHTILDVIRAAEAPTPLQPLPPSANPFELEGTWIGGRGWADGDGHPFCYLRLQSESLFRSNAESERPDAFSPWIGNRYTMGPENDQGLNFEKSILPTRTIFQAGLHTGAGCKLDYPFSGCAGNQTEEFCQVEKHAHKYGYTIVRKPIYKTADFSFEQRFDGFIFNKDAKTIQPDSQAFLYHIQIHREILTSESPTDTSNAYVTRFYPTVLQNLRQRGIELQVILPGALKNKNANIENLLGWLELKDL